MENGEDFSFDEGQVLSIMINNLKARKMLLKGHSKYLAHAVSKPIEPALNLQSTLVVCEFSDMFPDEFPGLTLVRKVKFSIELALGTITNSKAPYRMTLVKLQKL